MENAKQMSDENRKIDNIVSKVITGVVIGIGVMVIFLLWGDVQGVTDTITSIPFHMFLLTVIMTLLSYLIRYIKWEYLLRELNVKIPWRDSLNIFFIGLSMSITPGKIGEILKAYLIKNIGGYKMPQSMPAVFADRFSDLFSILVLIGLGVSIFSIGYYAIVILFLLLITITLLLRSKQIVEGVINLFCRVGFIKKHRESLITIYSGIYTLLSRRTFFVSVSIGIVAWFMECVSLYILVKSLSIDLSLLHNTFIFSFSTVAGALSMVPGGLGVAEGSLTGLFMYFDVNQSIAVTLTILIRLVTLWLGVVIGLMIFFSKKKKYML
jgi:uncharacterized protein (TIRG00374 family)